MLSAFYLLVSFLILAVCVAFLRRLPGLSRPHRQAALGGVALCLGLLALVSGTVEESAHAVPDVAQLQLERSLFAVTETTCTDDDAGTSPACASVLPQGETLAPACQDANGCTLALARPPAGQHQKMKGKVLTVVNRGASNTVTIAEVPGTNEQAGSAALGPYDAIQYRGINVTVDGGVWGRWVETGRSNN